jgi:D-amino-acid dehydrogenase
VVGLAAGHYLSRAGADVTILERSSCGSGASAGNTGWITPALSTPVPAPGVVWQALRWLVKPDSPFLIRPRADWRFARWCWQFARNSREALYRNGLRALLALNAHTFGLYDELRASGLDFELHEAGLLIVAADEHRLADYQKTFRELAALGYGHDVAQLTGDELVAVEPALRRGLAGGLYAPAERHVRPETLTSALVSHLLSGGASILENVGVEALRPRRGAVWALETPTETLEFDKVILAGGAWTGLLLERLKTPLRLEAAKGYSVTSAGSGLAPSHAIYLAAEHVACSPFDDGLRFAGTLELAGLDLRLDARRIAAVRNAASRYLVDWEPVGTQLEWAGLRPLAPDGLPYIGGVPGHTGLYVATGHGMLGVTLAPATGFLLASAILEDELPAELIPFRLDR